MKTLIAIVALSLLAPASTRAEPAGNNGKEGPVGNSSEIALLEAGFDLNRMPGRVDELAEQQLKAPYDLLARTSHQSPAAAADGTASYLATPVASLSNLTSSTTTAASDVSDGDRGATRATVIIESAGGAIHLIDTVPVRMP